jgi:hypothetical protein
MRVVTLVVLVAGCGDPNADDDGDLIPNREEEELGTDPLDDDTDDDGLTDGIEVYQADTDPLRPDTDGDGYLDGWEIDAGTDPKDAASVIYRGGWPYVPDKDRFGTPTSEAATAGAALPRATFRDQYGDDVDIYDFAGRGRALVLSLGGLNCSKCFQVASHVNGAVSSLTAGEKAAIACAADDITAGQVTWITALYANAQGTKATEADLETWVGLYPNPDVPVLLDDALALRNWISPRDTPAFVVVDPVSMTVSVPTTTRIEDLAPICP